MNFDEFSEMMMTRLELSIPTEDLNAGQCMMT